MTRVAATSLPFLVALALAPVLPCRARAQQSSADAIANRMLDRSAERVRNRPELVGRLSAGFNQDSLSVYALRGLRSAEDSTLLGWFAGLSNAVNLLDAPMCAGMTAAPPSPRAIIQLVARSDSAVVDHWLSTWEDAASAAFTGVKRPPVPDSAMVIILFGMVADLNKQADSLGEGQECRKLHAFLDYALALPWQDRVTVFRGFSEQIAGKKKH